MKARPIAFDCRYYSGDRPCAWHKQDGVTCYCAHHAPVSERVLLIKLDAMGDVLRTTALLPALAAAHPQAAITWLTRAESLPLLAHNPYVHEVLTYGVDATVHLSARIFDRVINLDTCPLSAGLATLARAPRKDGFVLHENGHARPTNIAAYRWLQMSICDDLKRANKQTYQQLMLNILGLPDAAHRYVLEVTAAERHAAREHLCSLGVDPGVAVVGLNTGAGSRWELKRWPEDGFLALMQRLHRSRGVQFLLLGGPDGAERNQRLTRAAHAVVFDAGGANHLRRFCALIAHCDVVVSGDTLAMHIALALRRRVVALFGPTSAAEIALYDSGEAVRPAMDCLGCYKTRCDFVPNCMDLITVEMAAGAVTRQLDLALEGQNDADSLPRTARTLSA